MDAYIEPPGMDAYSQGYQDGMQGLEPASDHTEYMQGYMDAPRDRASGFAGLSADQLLKGASNGLD